MKKEKHPIYRLILFFLILLLILGVTVFVLALLTGSVGPLAGLPIQRV